MSRNLPLKTQLRREKIIPLLVKGNSLHKIALELSVSVSTIKRDIDSLRSEVIDNFHEKPLDNFLGECLLQIKEVTNECWKSVVESKKESSRISSLNLILKTIDTKMTILEKFGIEYEMVGGAKVMKKGFSAFDIDTMGVLEAAAEYGRKRKEEANREREEKEKLRRASEAGQSDEENNNLGVHIR